MTKKTLEGKSMFWSILEFISGAIAFIILAGGASTRIFEYGLTTAQETNVIFWTVIVSIIFGVVCLFAHWATNRYDFLIKERESKRRRR